MRFDKPINFQKRSSGFTLFEMVVVICSIAILYLVAEERLNELPAAAERASYFAVLDQIKIGVNFEMYTRLANRDTNGLMALENTNPMDLLLEAPRNYRGVLPEVTDRNVERRASWYFEESSGELVYVVGGSSIEDVFVDIGNTSVNYGQIRLQLTNVYQDVKESETESGEYRNTGKWDALLLLPKWEYRWQQRPETPVPI